MLKFSDILDGALLGTLEFRFRIVLVSLLTVSPWHEAGLRVEPRCGSSLASNTRFVSRICKIIEMVDMGGCGRYNNCQGILNKRSGFSPVRTKPITKDSINSFHCTGLCTSAERRAVQR